MVIEGLIDSQHGIPVLLATIAIALSLNVFVKLGEFIYNFFKEKNETTEEAIKSLITTLGDNTTSIKSLITRMEGFEKELSDVSKYKKDIRRIFSAIKTLAGDNWSEIRKSIIEDDISS